MIENLIILSRYKLRTLLLKKQACAHVVALAPFLNAAGTVAYLRICGLLNQSTIGEGVCAAN
jgi:hypothetical protein